MTALTESTEIFAFEPGYARLPERSFARIQPTPVAAPQLIRVNKNLAEHLGLDPEKLASTEGVEMLAGNRTAASGDALAMAYAGHQFGQFVPQLGDGRAILLGEVTDRAGMKREIQLKGAGPTPFSRRGDGRAALGPVLREYVVSETMAALGIPTTRALAAVTTGEYVMRDRPLPGAVLTRVAASHIRVGTFQFFAARGDGEGIKLLADYVIARHYPDAVGAANPYAALFDMIVARQADLIAQWMLVGFIHGVMNTDNMTVSGETIDYGPCAFMDAYHAGTVYSSIDARGRYAFSNQPAMAHWNLTRLAESLLPLFSADEDAAVKTAQSVLDRFPARFEASYSAGLCRKLGLLTPRPDDTALALDLLERMDRNNADFTLTFRGLGDLALAPDESAVGDLFADRKDFDAWAVRWRQRLAEGGGDPQARRAAMHAVNPAFIPRNHLVEEMIVAAVDNGSFQPFEQLLAVLSRPYEDQPAFSRYANPPQPHEIVHQTFCGT